MTLGEGTEVSRDIDPRISNDMDLNRMIVSETTRDIDPGASDLCKINFLSHIITLTTSIVTSDGAETLASLKLMEIRCPRNLASQETVTRTPVINDSLVYKLQKLLRLIFSTLFKLLNIIPFSCCSLTTNMSLYFYSSKHTSRILKDRPIFFLFTNDPFSDITGTYPSSLGLRALRQGPPCLYAPSIVSVQATPMSSLRANLRNSAQNPTTL